MLTWPSPRTRWSTTRRQPACTLTTSAQISRSPARKARPDEHHRPDLPDRDVSGSEPTSRRRAAHLRTRREFRVDQVPHPAFDDLDARGHRDSDGGDRDPVLRDTRLTRKRARRPDQHRRILPVSYTHL